MHFIKYNDENVSFTHSTSRKVKHIREYGKLTIAFGMLSKNYNDIKVEINEDEKVVREAYDFMKNAKNTHYKKTFQDLVVLTYQNI